MKKYTELFMKLRPGERRLVVVVGLIFFVVLNWLFIVPQFHGFARATLRMEKAQKTLEMYRREVGHKAEYQRKVNMMESEGSAVPLEDQGINFERFYMARLNENNVSRVNNSPLSTHTNQFFVEQQMSINVIANETNLVNFLYSLGSGGSTMRVRSMSLRPEPSHQQLNANITLVSSYQKKVPPRATVPAASESKTAAAVPAPAKKPASVPTTGSNKTATASIKMPGVTNKLGPQTLKRP
ncbi:hypothetical protein [Pedosphaera parvula]|uniref:Uncharacterized protein n=1 Tax=Pedosphaera parvula (strain Ellin514) TaxID=320771 RepID=B9XM20_PEDPL|nr:hypothetical protein [Pedosphaera parvula]EEF59148.1 hypothetical protein Cflav_PD1640 [Pedosphaera parvula Ellin514]